jgi:GTP diphosphokinase / guanosine-3',5'-bis(diphosphate) 3'-diphosphatase
MHTFEKILDSALEANPSLNGDNIRRAYEYAERFLCGIDHVTGESLISHSLDVVDALITFHPREASIIAAFLHSIPELPGYDPADIEKNFGCDIAELVSSLAMLNRMKTVDRKADVDSLRKMFLAMARDIRVVMVKLADRLNGVRVLEAYPAAKRKLIARETLDIYVPIASRMGIYTVKTQMEDLCFKYLYPRQYEVLKLQLGEYKMRRGKNIDDIKRELKRFLDKNGLEAVVEGRIKNLYSIYKKLKLKSHTTLDDVYDIFAMRVIVPTRFDSGGREQTDHLYAVLGLIHSRWKPVTNRFKDYVAVPKSNGYQSLHTAVVGLSPLSSQATEIQIRSQRMHDEAEFGIAAHWVYEDLKKSLAKMERGNPGQVRVNPDDGVYGKYTGWLEALSRLQREMSSGSEFMEALKLDVFNDRIFVLTPTGEVKDLPLGATPLDFAYAVHTDVGHRCLLAKVNSVVVPLEYKLQSGEVVEIISGNKPNPKLHWLAFVKTAGARTKIKSYFRGLDKERSFREGKETVNKLLGRMHLPPLDDELSLLREYGGKKISLKDRIAMVEEIGNGSVMASSVLKKAIGRAVPLRATKPDSLAESIGKMILPRSKDEDGGFGKGLYIAGETGLPHKFAQCCRPLRGQPIVAYVTRGHAVSIHNANCRVLSEADQRRIVEAAWSREKNVRMFPVKLLLKMDDRIGLIRDIAETIAAFSVNIVDFGRETVRENHIFREMVVEVSDHEQYSQIIEKLQRIRNVLDVEKVD